MSDDYDTDNIKVIQMHEAMRKRPGMYVGDPEKRLPTHHMLFFVVDALATLRPEQPIVVELTHNGAVVSLAQRNWSLEQLEQCLSGRGVSMGHHPAGWLCASVSLTRRFVVTHVHDGVSCEFHYRLGEKVDQRVDQRGDQDAKPAYTPRPTSKPDSIRFELELDSSIFPNHHQFDSALVGHYLDTQAALSGCRFVLDERALEYADLAAYLQSLSGPLLDQPFHFKAVLAEGIELELVLGFAARPAKLINTFVNTVPTQTGTHWEGFTRAYWQVVSEVLDEEYGYCNEGMHLVLSLTHPQPEYANPVRDALRNEEVTALVRDALLAPMAAYLRAHPATLARIKNNRHFGLHSF